jgi:hypothetical protein
MCGRFHDIELEDVFIEITTEPFILEAVLWNGSCGPNSEDITEGSDCFGDDIEDEMQTFIKSTAEDLGMGNNESSNALLDRFQGGIWRHIQRLHELPSLDDDSTLPCLKTYKEVEFLRKHLETEMTNRTVVEAAKETFKAHIYM